MSNGKINKIVLAYSGGLDTSVMLRWLKEKYQCEIVCYCADVGQGAEMDGLEEKAKATGASKLYIEDLRRRIRERLRLDGRQGKRRLRRCLPDGDIAGSAGDRQATD